MKQSSVSIPTWILVILAFVLGGFVVFSFTSRTQTPSLLSSQTSANNSLPDYPPNGSEAARLTPVESETVLVSKVIDGDTIELENGQRVRYIGIDTPETFNTTECYGAEATQQNKMLVLGKRVRLEKDISETDRYQRLLRYVWVDSTLVNEVLVREGYAHSSTYPPDVKYQDRFVVAQQAARDSNAGLWTACQSVKGATTTTTTPTSSNTSSAPTVPAVTPPPSSPPSSNTTPKKKTTPPSSSSTNSSPSPSGSSTSGCLIKGNVSSTNKIYHMPGCGSYEKTQINESAGERWFCSEDEAVAAGWRKAKNCPQ